MPTWLFPQKNPSNNKTLTLTTGSWLLHFRTGMEHQKLFKSNIFCRFLFPLAIVTQKYKTIKLLLIPCMYRFSFSFTKKVNNYTVSKTSKIFICVLKKKTRWNGPKHTSLSGKETSINRTRYLELTSLLYQRHIIFKTYYLPLDFLQHVKVPY